MSAQDVWQLKIPIRLTLAQDEISSPGDVKPVYLLASRFAYLPALAQQCLSFFQHVLLETPCQDKDKAKPTPWFEYEGLALNWTQPLGVLHDLLTPQPQPWPSQQQQQQQQQQHSPLAPAAFVTSAIPWCLTVHFRNQPASLVNSWQNSGTAQDHFLSSLKEAGYCCRGPDGCNAVMRLTVQDELWAAVNRGDAAVVRQHLAPLRLTPSQRQGSAVPTVPVRLFIRQHKAGSEAGLLGVWSDVHSTNRAVEVQQADGSTTLLAHLVHAVMPQHFPALQQLGPSAATKGSDAGSSEQQRQQQQAGDPVDAGSSAEQSPAAAATAAGSDQQAAAGDTGDPLGVFASTSSPAVGQGTSASSQITQQALSDAARGVPVSASSGEGAAAAGSIQLSPQWPTQSAVYVCGIQPDWRTPLGWLHAHLKAADGFLYVAVHIEL